MRKSYLFTFMKRIRYLLSIFVNIIIQCSSWRLHEAKEILDRLRWIRLQFEVDQPLAKAIALTS